MEARIAHRWMCMKNESQSGSYIYKQEVSTTADVGIRNRFPHNLSILALWECKSRNTNHRWQLRGRWIRKCATAWKQRYCNSSRRKTHWRKLSDNNETAPTAPHPKLALLEKPVRITIQYRSKLTIPADFAWPPLSGIFTFLSD